MYNYKVLLPTAGIGSRVSDQSHNLNKGLIAIDNKPVLSHIVEKFHPDDEIVVALGYGGDYVKQFFEIVYPERNFTFVQINFIASFSSSILSSYNSTNKLYEDL